MTSLDGQALNRTLTVGLLLFPDVEVLDFAGPFEVFSVASRIAGVDRPAFPPSFRIVTVAAEAGPIRARHGLVVEAECGLTDHPPLEVLIVPGGVIDVPMGNAATIAWLRARLNDAGLIASVCTGAFLLAEAGLPDRIQVTTHWEDLADLATRYPALDVVADVAFVDLGRIVTSAGISAGIDMSLHLVGRLTTADHAMRTARQMQYRWRDQPAS